MSLEVKNCNIVQLTWEELEENSTNFKQKFSQALREGFFYVEIPKDLFQNITETKKFADNLRSNETIKKIKLHPKLDYQERFGTQAVAFGALSKHWEEVYPKPVKEIAEAMNDMALKILKASLKHLSVPEDIWDLVTGELTTGKGANAFTLNHYKTGEQKIGLTPHKDLGWITLLFIDKMGLESTQDGKKWYAIPPKEGYFVVNFGRAFELLIGSTDKLRASLHRVRHIEEKEGERTSFGLFNFHTEGAEVFQMKENNDLAHFATYEEYLNLCYLEFKKTQDGKNHEE